MADVLTVEEVTLNAWPALQTLYLNGWVLRFAAGHTGRANSVSPLYPLRDSISATVALCEAAYRRRELPIKFKITPVAEPRTLDDALAERDYRHESEARVMVRDIRGFEPEQDPAITLAEEDFTAWLAVFATLSELPEEKRPTLAAMLGKIVPRAAYVTLTEGDEPSAAGMAVVERGLVGVYNVVTAEGARRQGFARRIVQTLLGWGRAQGAQAAYLQVRDDNSPGIKLYEALEFTEYYRYWYRVKDWDTE